jgi:hypothetical protein
MVGARNRCEVELRAVLVVASDGTMAVEVLDLEVQSFAWCLKTWLLPEAENFVP